MANGGHMQVKEIAKIIEQAIYRMTFAPQCFGAPQQDSTKLDAVCEL
jgi:hypothetical protein